MTKSNWKIKLQWVKAHARIGGNELTDTKAKGKPQMKTSKKAIKESQEV